MRAKTASMVRVALGGLIDELHKTAAGGLPTAAVGAAQPKPTVPASVKRSLTAARSKTPKPARSWSEALRRDRPRLSPLSLFGGG